MKLNPLSKKLLTYFSLACVTGVTAIGIASAIVYSQLPPVNDLKDYRPRMAMQVFTQDGQLIGEFGEEKRKPVAIKDVPKNLINALLAIEDSRFYDHGGIDYFGLARASLNNLIPGSNKQGASTITQQLAKNFFLTNEKTFTRKFYEAMMAKKIENNMTKDEILERYMNHIYLGERAYGFSSAADVYFGKQLKDLTLAECAMLAGLPQAPATNNPVRNLKNATERQHKALDRMLELGFITREERDKARAEPIRVVKRYSRTGIAYSVQADYVAEMTRVLMYDRFKDAAYTEGLKVYTTIRSDEQNAAYAAVRKAVFAYDKKYGYRGPEKTYPIPTDANERGKALGAIFKAHPDFDQLRTFIVLNTGNGSLTGVLNDGTSTTISGADLGPAKALIGAPATNKKAIHVGAVLRVEQNKEGNNYHISQAPAVQASFVSMDPTDGAIHALVGGFDFDLSKFNHITQSYRQPGSTIKPFIYSAAMEKNKLNPNSLVDDSPIKVGSWEPKNADGQYLGPIPLSTALASSRNMVSIRLLQSMGNDYFRSYAQRFGFEAGRIDKYLTVALGAIETTPYQLVGAYGVFANGGYKVDPYIIAKVVDRNGNVIMEVKPKRAGDEKNRIITKENAAMVNALLQGVVRGGTARAASGLGRSDIAGKTGTTNDAVDAWFAGYQPKLVAIAWMGFDTGNKSLGAGEFGGGLALPIWMDYMRVALKGQKIVNPATSWGNGETVNLTNVLPTDPNATTTTTGENSTTTPPAMPPKPPEELKADPNSVPLPGSEARQSSETVNEAEVKVSKPPATETPPVAPKPPSVAPKN